MTIELAMVPSPITAEQWRVQPRLAEGTDALDELEKSLGGKVTVVYSPSMASHAIILVGGEVKKVARIESASTTVGTDARLIIEDAPDIAPEMPE